MLTQFFFGDVVMTSPDGKVPYGKTVSLVKRQVNPSAKTITETILQAPRDPRQKPKDIVTTLTWVKDSNEFAVRDADGTFAGSMTFAGADWSWNQWTYDITLTDGSRLTGSGSLDSGGIKTEKTLLDPSGKPAVHLQEDLRSIPSEEYQLRHKQLMGD
jgi:hypothetical protein